MEAARGSFCSAVFLSEFVFLYVSVFVFVCEFVFLSFTVFVSLYLYLLIWSSPETNVVREEKWQQQFKHFVAPVVFLEEKNSTTFYIQSTIQIKQLLGALSILASRGCFGLLDIWPIALGFMPVFMYSC